MRSECRHSLIKYLHFQNYYNKMALTEGSSFVVSSIISLLLFSGMQVYKNVLASTQLLTIAAGFTGSLLYVFLLTAVANLEKSVFGWNFQTKLGEVIFFNILSDLSCPFFRQKYRR